MGPGSYDPNLADNQTKPKTPNINLGSSPGRPEHVGQTAVTSSIRMNEARISPSENFSQTKKRPDSRKASQAYKSLKPKEPISKLMEPVRTANRQSENSDRQARRTNTMTTKTITTTT